MFFLCVFTGISRYLGVDIGDGMCDCDAVVSRKSNVAFEWCLQSLPGDVQQYVVTPCADDVARRGVSAPDRVREIKTPAAAYLCSSAFCSYCAACEWCLVGSWGARLGPSLLRPGHRSGCKNSRTKLWRRRPILFENALAIEIYMFRAGTMP